MEESKNDKDTFFSSIMQDKTFAIFVGILVVLFFGFRIIVYQNIPMKLLFLSFYTLIACAVIISFLIHYHKQQAYNKCKSCPIIELKNNMKLFNLFKFDELLKIEKSVGKAHGKGREVLIYSINGENDDNEDKPEVDKVVKFNKKKGVKYYDVYYTKTNKNYSIDDDIELNVFFEKYQNVWKEYSQILKEKDCTKKFLDYQLYKDTRFDMMVYKWSSERIEGYFCVNFPLKKACSFKTQGNGCRNPCAKKDEELKTLFYKKMPKEISNALYESLTKWIEMKNRNETRNEK